MINFRQKEFNRKKGAVTLVKNSKRLWDYVFPKSSKKAISEAMTGNTKRLESEMARGSLQRIKKVPKYSIQVGRDTHIVEDKLVGPRSYIKDSVEGGAVPTDLGISKTKLKKWIKTGKISRKDYNLFKEKEKIARRQVLDQDLEVLNKLCQKQQGRPIQDEYKFQNLQRLGSVNMKTTPNMNTHRIANSKEDKVLLSKAKKYFKEKYPEVKQVGKNRGYINNQQGISNNKLSDHFDETFRKRDRERLESVGLNAHHEYNPGFFGYSESSVHTQSGLRERPSTFLHEFGHHEFDVGGGERAWFIRDAMQSSSKDTLRHQKARFLNEANASRNAYRNAEKLGASKEQLETIKKELSEALESYRTPEMKKNLSPTWGKGLFSNYYD